MLKDSWGLQAAATLPNMASQACQGPAGRTVAMLTGTGWGASLGLGTRERKTWVTSWLSLFRAKEACMGGTALDRRRVGSSQVSQLLIGHVGPCPRVTQEGGEAM